ncbi:MAG: hypothetical protein QNJ57_05430 [Flavobacteriaceae bacterium]|nr:hypothetical protein [Flavobacteriaceae bacterium]
MKKLSILFFVAFLGFAGTTFAQKAEKNTRDKEKAAIAAIEAVKSTRIKIDLERLPNSILVSLRDSYAKHFVTQAYKARKGDDIYFVELRKGRTLFTVAVDNNGRVLKEIRDSKILDQNAVANKN